MQVVIDVPEQEYNILKNLKIPMTWAEHLIAKGVPLPKIYEMREATAEELESVNNYIQSISRPTGVNIWDEIDNEKKIDEIKVGDEVIVQDHIVGFVTEIDSSSGEIHVTTEHGWNDVFHKNFVKKTGRYFPNVAAILKAKFMKEANIESEDN